MIEPGAICANTAAFWGALDITPPDAKAKRNEHGMGVGPGEARWLGRRVGQISSFDGAFAYADGAFAYAKVPFLRFQPPLGATKLACAREPRANGLSADSNGWGVRLLDYASAFHTFPNERVSLKGWSGEHSVTDWQRDSICGE